MTHYMSEHPHQTSFLNVSTTSMNILLAELFVKAVAYCSKQSDPPRKKIDLVNPKILRSQHLLDYPIIGAPGTDPTKIHRDAETPYFKRTAFRVSVRLLAVSR